MYTTGLSLNICNSNEKSNEELLLSAYDGNVPTSLIQKLYKYGRYLLITSSFSSSMPANLQGIWNGDFMPAWNSDFHTDENIQMNYWQALPGNLPETTFPFFDYFETFLKDYKENAQKIFGCRGIFVPIAQTTSGLIFPCVWINWISAAGWLGQLFYDYYLFTEDTIFLENRTIPWLKETALFYEDFLIEDENGKLLFSLLYLLKYSIREKYGTTHNERNNGYCYMQRNLKQSL